MIMLLTRNLWRKLRGMRAFTTIIIVRMSKTKTKKVNSWEKTGKKFNLSCPCEYFSNPKPMFPSVLMLTLSSL